MIAGSVGVVLPRIMRATERAQAAVGEMGSVLERVLGAIRTVKASGAEGREAAALEQAAGKAYEQGMHNARYQALVGTSTAWPCRSRSWPCWASAAPKWPTARWRSAT